MLVKEATAVVKIGTGNSKMPGSTFSQDAFSCNVGSKLAKIEGSVCKSCYARKLQKLRPSVNMGWTANYEKSVAMIAHKPSVWVAACVFQIKRQSEKSGVYFHRWFDSGDIDSLAQLEAIVEVVLQTCNISHWLPTREVKTVLAYKRKHGNFPANLIVRVSAPMVNQAPLKGHTNTSTVCDKKHGVTFGHVCPAPSQGGNCGDCRACWTKSVPNVTYIKH